MAELSLLLLFHHVQSDASVNQGNSGGWLNSELLPTAQCILC
jgi:hypothetical protein